MNRNLKKSSRDKLQASPQTFYYCHHFLPRKIYEKGKKVTHPTNSTHSNNSWAVVSTTLDFAHKIVGIVVGMDLDRFVFVWDNTAVVV